MPDFRIPSDVTGPENAIGVPAHVQDLRASSASARCSSADTSRRDGVDTLARHGRRTIPDAHPDLDLAAKQFSAAGACEVQRRFPPSDCRRSHCREPVCRQLGTLSRTAFSRAGCIDGADGKFASFRLYLQRRPASSPCPRPSVQRLRQRKVLSSCDDHGRSGLDPVVPPSVHLRLIDDQMNAACINFLWPAYVTAGWALANNCGIARQLSNSKPGHFIRFPTPCTP